MLARSDPGVARYALLLADSLSVFERSDGSTSAVHFSLTVPFSVVTYWCTVSYRLTFSEPICVRQYARVRPALIVMRDPASQYNARLVVRQRNERVQALSARGANNAFTETVSLGVSIRWP